MSDFDSSLPTSITDHTDPEGVDKQVEVSEKLIHNRTHGEDSDGTKRQLKLSEEGKSNGRGDYHVTENSEPQSSGLIAHERQAVKSQDHQTKRISAVDGSDNTTCQDVAIRDENGVPYSDANPLNVVMSESDGDELTIFNTSAAVAKDASVNHDYTVTALKKLRVRQVFASASGRTKVEIFTETGVGTNLFNTRLVGFGTASNPNVPIDLKSLLHVLAGTIIRIKITNTDNQPFDVYSTLSAIEL